MIRPQFLRYSPWLLAAVALVGCWLISIVLHEPNPRIHDEFSYVLMGEAIAQGHAASPKPPLPEFFDTFHVLVRPAYVSKYFPVQGVFRSRWNHQHCRVPTIASLLRHDVPSANIHQVTQGFMESMFGVGFA